MIRQLKAVPTPRLFAYVTLALLAIWLIAATPGQASDGHERTFDPTPGQITPPDPGAPPLRDRVLEKSPLSSRAVRAAEQAYTAPGGEVVYVAVSDYYVPDSAADQALVDFFANLTHGSELNGLHVYVAGPPEMADLCGGEAAACYDPQQQRMYIVGEAEFGGLPTDYVAAHEYGHHIALHRLNPPFGAFNWGTKRWASYQGVCPGTDAGKLFPGDEGPHYYENPAEAFAEEYALAHYPGLIPWEYTPFLTPNQTSTALLLQDVTDPWTRNTTTIYSGRLRSGQTGSFKVKTPLDGRMKLSLKGPGGADFDLYLTYRNRIVAKSRGRGSRESIGYLVCGEAKFKVFVDAYKGGGRSSVTVSKP